jgi:hypothetical protein
MAADATAGGARCLEAGSAGDNLDDGHDLEKLPRNHRISGSEIRHRLPAHVHAPIEIALGGAKAPVADWQKLGWRVIKSDLVSQTAAQYRQYIQSSRGELSVAKNVYVATRCGWFSCRSVCYLAAGLPVVVQDTGFSEIFPVGEGLFSFADLTQAIAGLQAVEADYDRHQRAARALAENYFAAEIVLGDLLRRIGL